MMLHSALFMSDAVTTVDRLLHTAPARSYTGAFDSPKLVCF